jgi:site-specific DNA-cytosine methylase
MKVLSLFDGIAGAAQALKELNIDCEYYACEIDRWAIKIARNNHFDINHLGSSYCGLDVKYFLCDEWEATTKEIQDIGGYTKHKEFIGNTDLLIGGSPCQDLSVAKRGGKGLDGNKSGLFFEYLRILNKVKPKYFILENVASMKAIDRDKISKYLFDIEPIKICSSLLTAQMRKRLYWVGALQEDGSYKKVEIKQPEDKGIALKDIIESGDTERLKSYCIPATYYKENVKSLLKRKKEGLFISLKDMVRKLTPIECERLQGFPDNYSESVSNSQRYKALGNSFTVPVIKHILKSVLTNEK